MGSCSAIYVADALHLDGAAAAGSIALLTILTTKWETLKLSLARLVTFVLTVALGWILFLHFNSAWVAYGVYIFLIVLLCELLGWKSTISVNAVIGTHFLTAKDFSHHFVINELLLLVIGISIAIVLNLFNGNEGQKKKIIQNMRFTEQRLQMILGEMAAYLSNKNMQRDVWADIKELEQQLREFVSMAWDYQNNTFQSHPQYYIEYFEMRSQQLGVLHNLHYEMKKIRTMPVQAKVIAEYILYLTDYVIEVNVPTKQIQKLEEIFQDMKKEPLPVSREEFESRAMLYHILMDIEEFLVYKKRFVDELSKHQLERYWKKDKGF